MEKLPPSTLHREMFHVKQINHKTFDLQTVRCYHLKQFMVKVSLEHFVKQNMKVRDESG